MTVIKQLILFTLISNDRDILIKGDKKTSPFYLIYIIYGRLTIRGDTKTKYINNKQQIITMLKGWFKDKIDIKVTIQEWNKGSYPANSYKIKDLIELEIIANDLIRKDTINLLRNI